MADDAPSDPIRRLVTRLLRRRPPSSRPPGPEDGPPDLRLPEQRLIDASARYGRIATADGPSRRTDSAAAGVRTVAATEPADAGAPVWVRRLAEPAAERTDPGEPIPASTGSSSQPGAARRPRRH
jgi:hypothetical protein